MLQVESRSYCIYCTVPSSGYCPGRQTVCTHLVLDEGPKPQYDSGRYILMAFDDSSLRTYQDLPKLSTLHRQEGKFDAIGVFFSQHFVLACAVKAGSAKFASDTLLETAHKHRRHFGAGPSQWLLCSNMTWYNTIWSRMTMPQTYLMEYWLSLLE